jgi:hypothetical protein
MDSREAEATEQITLVCQDVAVVERQNLRLCSGKGVAGADPDGAALSSGADVQAVIP